jgi:hypothetical protein
LEEAGDNKEAKRGERGQPWLGKHLTNLFPPLTKLANHGKSTNRLKNQQKPTKLRSPDTYPGWFAKGYQPIIM